MGRLTPEMIAKIKTVYAEKMSYKLVADELNLDWKTVKAHTNGGKNDIADEQRWHKTNQRDSREEIASATSQDQAEQSQRERQPQKSQPTEYLTQSQIQPRARKSSFAVAISLFEKGKTPVQVAISLDLPFEDVEKYYAQYGRLSNLERFYEICQGPPGTLESLIKLHNRMCQENLDIRKLVKQLKYVGPIIEASKRCTELGERIQRLEIESTKKEEINSRLDSIANASKDRTNKIEKDFATLKDNFAQLERRYKDRQAAFSQLMDSESKISAQIVNEKATLRDLTSENGPIKEEVRRIARQKTYEILNNDEELLTFSLGAAFMAINQDAAGFLRFHNQMQMLPGESMEAHMRRCVPLLKERLGPVYHQFIENIIQEVSTQMVRNYGWMGRNY